jgi:Type II restriction endonuclease, TdeIII
MNKDLRSKLKQVLTDSIKSFFLKKLEDGISTSNILDILFPRERRIRSLIGGLETSMGTTVWEMVARELAINNGFEVLIDKQILMPSPFPENLQKIVEYLANQRKNGKFISTTDCIDEIRRICKSLDKTNLNFIDPPSGHGVDIYLKKDNIEYVFDMKSPQANVGDFPRYSRQLLDWYAYRFSENPSVDLRARIAFTFNPYKQDYYEKQKTKIGTNLDRDFDIFVENEFWDFCSGYSNTSDTFCSLFEELRKENFHEQFHDIFYGDIE